MTLAAYLLRVGAYLLAFTGIAAGAFWSVRAIELVRSAVDRRGGTTGPDP